MAGSLTKTEYVNTVDGLRRDPKVNRVSTGWKLLDQHFMPFPGMFCAVMGTPGSGKTNWLIQQACMLGLTHGHKTMLTLFENDLEDIDEVVGKFCAGKRLNYSQFFKDHLTIFRQPLTDDGTIDVDWLFRSIQTVLDLKKDWRPDWVMVDPWNQIELDEPGLSTEQQQKRDLKRMAKWFKNRKIGLFLAAHPTKNIVKPDGSTREVNGYDISGSAHWKNRCDYILCLERGDRSDEELRRWMKLKVDKVRKQKAGLHEGSTWFQTGENTELYHTSKDGPDE